MWFIEFMRSVPGLVLRAALGVWLITYGSTHASLLGLVLMMVGMVPAVTGLTGICLIGEVMKSRRASQLPAVRPREHRV